MLCASTLVAVFALISALNVAVADAHSPPSSLESTMASLPGATDQATGVSCMPDGPCIAIDYSGQVYVLSGNHVALIGDIGIATFGVSCPTLTYCVLVSEDAAVVLHASQARGYPLEYGNGSDTHWQSISCSSPSFCMAGGGLIGGPEDGAGVVASWNGYTWSPVRVILPDIPSEFKTTISSMSCTGPTFCVAADQDQRVTQWNGKRWTEPSALNEGIDSIATACLSARFCLAVGSDSHSAWDWNGRSWQLTRISDLSTPFLAPFVGCLSSSDCVAVTPMGSGQRWNGSNWGKAQQLYADHMDDIQGFSCSSAGFCEAVTGGDHFIYVHDAHQAPRLPVLCSLGCKSAVT